MARKGVVFWLIVLGMVILVSGCRAKLGPMTALPTATASLTAVAVVPTNTIVPPTATVTASPTEAQPSATPSATPLPTETPTSTDTPSPTIDFTATAALEQTVQALAQTEAAAALTATQAALPSDTPTSTFTPTDTLTPSDTPTPTQLPVLLTVTRIVQNATATAQMQAAAQTQIAAALTATQAALPSDTPTATATPTDTATPSPTATYTPSTTPTPLPPTDTLTPSTTPLPPTQAMTLAPSPTTPTPDLFASATAQALPTGTPTQLPVLLTVTRIVQNATATAQALPSATPTPVPPTATPTPLPVLLTVTRIVQNATATAQALPSATPTPVPPTGTVEATPTTPATVGSAESALGLRFTLPEDWQPLHQPSPHWLYMTDGTAHLYIYRGDSAYFAEHGWGISANETRLLAAASALAAHTGGQLRSFADKAAVPILLPAKEGQQGMLFLQQLRSGADSAEWLLVSLSAPSDALADYAQNMVEPLLESVEVIEELPGALPTATPSPTSAQAATAEAQSQLPFGVNAHVPEGWSAFLPINDHIVYTTDGQARIFITAGPAAYFAERWNIPEDVTDTLRASSAVLRRLGGKKIAFDPARQMVILRLERPETVSLTYLMPHPSGGWVLVSVSAPKDGFEAYQQAVFDPFIASLTFASPEDAE